MQEKHRYSAYAVLMLGLFVTALFLPALFESMQGYTWPEAYGWEALLYGYLTPPWYANIPLLIGSYAFLVLRRVETALFLGAVSSTLAVLGVPLVYVMAFEPGIGYYLWAFSCLTLLVASVIEFRLMHCK